MIGNADDCDLILSNSFVSGHHCQLTITESGFVLDDRGSTNGTFVDGVRLTPHRPVTVTRQQVITLGQSVPFPWEKILSQSTVNNAPAPAKSITVGRVPGNDVVIDYPIVSSHHARVDLRNGQFYLSDTNSTNGTSVNTLENRIAGPTPIRSGDDVFLGSYKLPASKLLDQFSKPASTAIGDANFKKVTLLGDSMVIGRDPECDQTLDFPMISWRHARVTRTPEGMFVEDLGSRNGTFVDGKRTTGVTRVQPGQQIALGSFRFQLLQGGELARRHDLGYTIEARGITVQAKDGNTILSPVSFTVFAGELVALMGTSGAGKTTLLKALNGYTPPSSGTVFYNGKNLYQFYDEYSQQVGYVPQDDIVHERLTVREALSYAARLRTPLTEPEIKAEAEKVAHDLGLTDKLDSVIGSPENKILSGGQRKRVNIALELICGTPVLFLDEPTSGLSSADADGVVKLLKRLAREGGKTIITTIHAPSLEAYREFDNLIMLSRDEGRPGGIVYYGPAYPDSIEFVAHKGAASGPPIEKGLGPEVLMTTLQQDKDKPDPDNTAARWGERFQASKYFKQFVQDRAGRNPSGTPPSILERGRGGTDFTQWIKLLRRNLIVRYRDKGQLLIQGLQAPIFALLIVAIFGKLPDPVAARAAQHLPPPAGFLNSITNASGIHFLMVVAAVWFGCNNAVRDVVGELLIYQRERMVCLRLPSYIFSKLFVLNAICLVQCLVMLGIVYTVCNLRSGFFVTLAVLWLTSMVGASIGLLISSAPFCKTTESAIALLPIVLLPMIGLGGGIRPVYHLPAAATWASNLIATRWSFEANLVREAVNRGEQEFIPNPDYPNEIGDIAQPTIPKYVDGEKRVPKGRFEENRHPLAQCLIALAAMFVVCVSGVLLSLRSRDVHH